MMLFFLASVNANGTIYASTVHYMDVRKSLKYEFFMVIGIGLLQYDLLENVREEHELVHVVEPLSIGYTLKIDGKPGWSAKDIAPSRTAIVLAVIAELNASCTEATESLLICMKVCEEHYHVSLVDVHIRNIVTDMMLSTFMVDSSKATHVH